MKKAAFSVLVCLFAFCFTKIDAQITTTKSRTHAHEHMTTGVASVIYDPWGTGRIQEDVYLSVNLADHPGLSIVSTSIYVTLETANDHYVLLDITGTSDFLAHGIEYNMNDEPYWLSYGWEVIYSDGTFESVTTDYYF